MSGSLALFRVRWAAIGAAVAVTLGGGALGVVHATVSSGERAVFVPITPCRLLDTRPAPDTVGDKGSPLGPGETHHVSIDDGQCNGRIPADAAGVSLNVTTLGATDPTFITIWATGDTQPNASSLNPSPGQPPTPNAVNTAVSADGEFDIYNLAGSVDVLADANGYYVDHNHDDRYYTKAELDHRTVRVSINPLDMVGDDSNAGVFGLINECVVSASSDRGQLLLSVPIGARLVSVDVGFLDGDLDTVYSAALVEKSAGSSGLSDPQARASTEGGSGLGSGYALVKHHLTVDAATTVEDGDVFGILFSGLDDSANGVCYVTVEYDPAP